MSELALSCYESSLCFFNTTSLLSHKFWCLSVNLVQKDLKVFVAVRGKAGWLSQSFICLACVFRLEAPSRFSSQFSQSFSRTVFFFPNYLQITAETNQGTWECVEVLSISC